MEDDSGLIIAAAMVLGFVPLEDGRLACTKAQLVQFAMVTANEAIDAVVQQLEELKNG